MHHLPEIPANREAGVVAPELVRVELERILASKPFASSGRLKDLLRYAVERSLSGEADELKESVLGVSVFGRVPGYDPRVDPIVRVMAGRLRTRLQQYYGQENAQAAVRIEFPRGSYVPRFQWNECPPSRPRAGFPIARVPWAAAVLAVLAILLGVWLRGRTVSRDRAARHQDAYRLYTRGEACIERGAFDDLQFGIQYLKLALTRDPDYALAHAMLALAYCKLVETEKVLASEVLFQAKAEAQTAMRLNAFSAETHHALAQTALFQDYDWGGSAREFEAALAIDPSYADARYNYARLSLNLRGLHDEAVRQLQAGLKQDPLSSSLNTELARTELHRGSADRAIDLLRQHLPRYPDAPGARTQLAIALEAKGEYAEAIQELSSARKEMPDSPWVAGHLAFCNARLGRRSDAQAILDDLATHIAPAPEYTIAVICAGLGNPDVAFEHLERAWSQHSVQLLWLRIDGRLQTLRSDRRFERLLVRLHLAAGSRG